MKLELFSKKTVIPLTTEITFTYKERKLSIFHECLGNDHFMRLLFIGSLIYNSNFTKILQPQISGVFAEMPMKIIDAELRKLFYIN